MKDIHQLDMSLDMSLNISNKNLRKIQTHQKSKSVSDINPTNALHSNMESYLNNQKIKNVGYGSSNTDMIKHEPQRATKAELTYARSKMKKIIDECKIKLLTARKRAVTYKYLNIAISLFIILGSLVTGIFETFREDKNYLYISLSFSMTSVKLIDMILKIGQRGIYSKRADIEYQKILFEANDALFYADENNSSTLDKMIHDFQKRMHEISFTSYKISYGPQSFKDANSNFLDIDERIKEV